MRRGSSAAPVGDGAAGARRSATGACSRGRGRRSVAASARGRAGMGARTEGLKAEGAAAIANGPAEAATAGMARCHGRTGSAHGTARD